MVDLGRGHVDYEVRAEPTDKGNVTAIHSDVLKTEFLGALFSPVRVKVRPPHNLCGREVPEILSPGPPHRARTDDDHSLLIHGLVVPLDISCFQGAVVHRNALAAKGYNGPMVVLRDQRYPIEGGSLAYDFIRPEGDGPFPFMVFLHGGGWISGDKTMYRDEAVWLAAKGFACACIDYRLAPLYPFPKPVADCQAFLSFARSSASELAIDCDRITALGNSAGGHLALMLGLAPMRFDSKDSLAERANSVVSICGISDLTDPEGAHFDIAMPFLTQFMDGPFEGREEEWRRASPVTYIDHAQGRYLIMHGTDDDVVPLLQSQKLADALKAKGALTTFVPLPGEMHSFTIEGWDQIRRHYLEFVSVC